MADNKDPKVISKDELIIEGTIFADHFKNRQTGTGIDIDEETNTISATGGGGSTHLYKHSVLINSIEGLAEVGGSISGCMTFEFYSSNSAPTTSFYDLTNHGFINNSSKIISSNNFANTDGTTVLYIRFNFATSSARGYLIVVYADYGISCRTVTYSITATGYNDTVVQII